MMNLVIDCLKVDFHGGENGVLHLCCGSGGCSLWINSYRLRVRGVLL